MNDLIVYLFNRILLKRVLTKVVVYLMCLQFNFIWFQVKLCQVGKSFDSNLGFFVIQWSTFCCWGLWEDSNIVEVVSFFTGRCLSKVALLVLHTRVVFYHLHSLPNVFCAAHISTIYFRPNWSFKMPRGRSRGRNNNRTTDRFINESSRRDDGSFYGKNSPLWNCCEHMFALINLRSEGVNENFLCVCVCVSTHSI